MRLEARDVRVRYGRLLAVDGASLEARPGEVVALVGPNGCGKSSLLRSLAGLQRCEGVIAWDGGPAPPGSIGYMPQDTPALAGLTAFEVVLLGRLRSLALRVGTADLAAAQAAMEETGVTDLGSRQLGQLSGGQRQLVLLAQVLAGNPKALLLDEPTSALDIAHQLEMLEMLRAATRARQLVTVAVMHDLNAAARAADVLALMREGRVIACGSADDLLCPDLLTPTFRVHVAVDRASDGRPMVLPLRAVRS